jgi:hypothetical protein
MASRKVPDALDHALELILTCFRVQHTRPVSAKRYVCSSMMSLSEAGVDVVSLGARRGLSRYEITDQWRRW